jgi:hypothetical protein
MTATPPLTDEQHADLRARIAEALAARPNGLASDGRGWFRDDEERERFHAEADAVLAVAQPELDRLRAELAAARAQAFTDGAAELDSIADETEARVAAYYGAASGIGPGSADMVRECARTLRGLAAAPTATVTQCGPACSEQHTYDGCCQLGPHAGRECPNSPSVCQTRRCTAAAPTATT